MGLMERCWNISAAFFISRSTSYVIRVTYSFIKSNAGVHRLETLDLFSTRSQLIRNPLERMSEAKKGLK